MDNIFERATQLKIRFDVGRGRLDVEDLWDLPIKIVSKKSEELDLDTIYANLKRQLDVSQTYGLVKTPSNRVSILELQIAIIERIAAVKTEEETARKEATDKLAKKRRLLEIYAEKQDEGLRGKSEAELLQMIEEL